MCGVLPVYTNVHWKIKIANEKSKGKCIYITLIFVVHTRRSGVDHTVLPAIIIINVKNCGLYTS